MRGALATSVRSLVSFYRESIVRNAVFLLASNLVLSGMGFVFWVIAARLFPKAEIGVATVILTAASFTVAVGMVGLDAGIVRFLSTSEAPSDQVSSSLTLAGALTLTAGFIYVLIAPLLSDKLAFLRSDTVDGAVYLVLVLGLAAGTILQSTFISRRSAQFVLASNSLFSVGRVCLLPLLVAFGVTGIIGAGAGAVVAAGLFGLVVVARVYHLRPRPMIAWASLRRLRVYASTLYAASLESSLVVAAIPLVVLNHLGAGTAADYYVVVGVAALLGVVASATGQSLLAEGAHSPESLHRNIRKAVVHIFSVLLPLIVVFLLAGHFVLLLFGSSYAAQGTTFLRLLTVASPFVALNYVADSIVNVRQENRLFLVMNTFNAGLVLVLSFALIGHGLTGLGVAWLCAQAVTVAVYLMVFRRELAGFARGR